MRITRLGWLIGAMTVVVMVSVSGQDRPNTIQVQPGRGVAPTSSGVTAQDLLDGLKNPTRWITYGGDYTAKRYSPLTQLTPANVSRLVPQWTFQGDQPDNMRGTSASPLVLDGVMYFTENYNRVVAIDARTGRQIWKYQWPLPDDYAFDGPFRGTQPTTMLPVRRRFAHGVTRGSAIIGEKLIIGTLDSHIIALDIKNGKLLWDTLVADFRKGYEGTSAPLAIGDKVIFGSGGGDSPNRNFLDAYDANTGKRLWRFWTIPEPGEPGSETWPNNPDVMHGGATWIQGTYDPELNLIYWGTGNAQGPGERRPGDNLYTASIVAIDATTGKLRWYYQLAPHDVMDLDINTPPVIADLTIGGQLRKVVMLVPKTAYVYLLDRVTGKFISAFPLAPAATNWAIVGADGRPDIKQDSTHCLPDGQGIAGAWPPAYDPVQRLFYVTLRIDCSINNQLEPGLVPGAAGRFRIGGVGYNSLKAVDPVTGKVKWEHKDPPGDFGATGVTQARPGFGIVKSGAVTLTATGLLFTADNGGNFIALDSKTGAPLYHYQMGGVAWAAAPITYMLDGRQHVTQAAGLTLTDFALPQQ
jgi:alcohol dehydrogenase (cytochrome c)